MFSSCRRHDASQKNLPKREGNFVNFSDTIVKNVCRNGHVVSYGFTRKGCDTRQDKTRPNILVSFCQISIFLTAESTLKNVLVINLNYTFFFSNEAI